MNSESNAYTGYRPRPETQIGTMFVLLAFGLILGVGLVVYIGVARFHLLPRQIAEIAVYMTLGSAIPVVSVYFLVTRRSSKEKRERHPPLVIRRAQDVKHLSEAWAQDSVILGYNIHGDRGYGLTGSA